MIAYVKAGIEGERGFFHPVNRNINLLLTHNGLQNMLFCMPVLVLYYRDVIGLSFGQFLIGEVVFATAIVLMEVPSGWLSDVWRRKYVLMLGSLCELFGFVLLLMADNFTQAVIAQGAIGIGVSLVSGTNTAILYDTLLQYRKQAHYRRLEGQRHGMGLYIVAGAALAGALLYTVDPKLPLILTALFYAFAALSAIAIIEPVRETKTVLHNPLRDIVQTIHFTVRGHPEIGALMLFTGVLFGTTQAGFWIQQPYWMAQNVPEAWFGVLAAVGFFMAGFAGHHGHKMDKIMPKNMAFPVLLFGVALSYVVSGLFGLGHVGWAGILFLYTSSLAFGFGMPLVQDVINQRVGSARRATIASTANLVGRLFFIPVGWSAGMAVDHYAVEQVLIVMGVGLVFAGGIALWVMARHGLFKKETSNP